MGGSFSLLDDPIVRDSLSHMWNLSNPNDVVQNRLENGFWILKNSLGHLALIRMQPKPGTLHNAVHIEPAIPTGSEIPPGFDLETDLVAVAHSHPVKPWTSLPWGGQTGKAGLSEPDFDFSKTFSDYMNRLIPVIIVDHSRLWRGTKNPKTQDKKPRVSGSCVRV